MLSKGGVPSPEGQLVENNMEYNKNVIVAFVDQEKAFDRIDWELLW